MYLCLLQLLNTVGYNEEAAIWAYFQKHIVDDIIMYQTTQESSHEREEFEKMLENLIPIITQSNVSTYILK